MLLETRETVDAELGGQTSHHLQITNSIGSTRGNEIQCLCHVELVGCLCSRSVTRRTTMTRARSPY
ncbi:hypothetical protein WN55_04154 [Dufourea novaeangliae]|uniref:Uncharacterized protein n=1 Tax=Dufourea novaeangliae TaxID=178035 RepID=A0A154PLF1_DUFNO|nr:hypothetical protein WN55_04154 [Dufourea novaeangliae]